MRDRSQHLLVPHQLSGVLLMRPLPSLARGVEVQESNSELHEKEASVTPGMTGLVPCCDLSARGHRPRPGWRSWPDQELDHLALAAPDVSHHSPAEPPSRTGTTSRPTKERTHEHL